MSNPVEEALELLRDGEGWCQGSMSTRGPKYEDMRYCSIGAAVAARHGGKFPHTLSEEDWVAHAYLEKALADLGIRGSVMMFNDDPKTKFEDVKHVFEVAAKLWERDHD